MDWQLAKQQFSTPPFDSIREPLDRLRDVSTWPGVARLNDCAANVKNFRGQQIRFVADDDTIVAAHYETRIAESGEIASRENWHDFFNAMSWLAFPAAKSAISEMHARLLSASFEKELHHRSIPRDVLTLFDEGGIVVASNDESLLELIRRFEWKTLFVERRADVIAQLRFYLIGHSMLEKALEPYVGVTAKAILFLVDDNFLASNHSAQIRYLDQLAAAWLMDEVNLSSAKKFSPLPWLGVPGWWAENALPAFYNNTEYFRGGRRRKESV